MSDFSSLFDESASKRGRVPTTNELTDFVLDLDERTRAEIMVGAKAVVFDSDKSMDSDPSPFRVVDERWMNADERSNRLHFGTVGQAILDRNEDLQERLSSELVVSMQIGRDRVMDMMNRVRADHNKAPVVEPDLERGVYEGMIFAQCPSQSVMLSEGRAVLLEHSLLDKKPTPNSLSRVEFEGESGKVSTIVKSLEKPVAAKDPGKEKDKGK